MPSHSPEHRLLARQQRVDLVERVVGDAGAVGPNAPQFGRSAARGAVRVLAGDSVPERAREGILVEAFAYKRCGLNVERLGGIVDLAVERAQRFDHLLFGDRTFFVIAVGRERARQRGIDPDAENPRSDHDQHQCPGQGVDIPAEVETRMERADHGKAQAEIDVSRSPALEAPAPRRDRALAHAEHGQPQDQQRADSAERVAQPARTEVRARQRHEDVEPDQDSGERGGELAPEQVAVGEEALVRAGAFATGSGTLAWCDRCHRLRPPRSRAARRSGTRRAIRGWQRPSGRHGRSSGRLRSRRTCRT